jgi:CRISPR-associated exonuclease Cas4
MKAGYAPDELLPLSGIQHFVFCRRQWALIHVEQQWQENLLTEEVRIMHRRVDDPFFTEKRVDVIVARIAFLPMSEWRRAAF